MSSPFTDRLAGPCRRYYPGFRAWFLMAASSATLFVAQRLYKPSNQKVFETWVARLRRIMS